MPADAEPGALDSLERALVLLGDRWNLMIIRGALQGAFRYQDWKSTLPLSDPVLTTRLRDLVADGMLCTRVYSRSPVRKGYYLTSAGKDLWRLFVALHGWDMRWGTTSGRAPVPRLIHLSCGQEAAPQLCCASCGAAGVGPRDTTAHRTAGRGLGMANPPRRYRRSAQVGDFRIPDSIEVIGDRWSTAVLSASLLGTRRFGDFQRLLTPVPPGTLTERLGMFAAQGVLAKQPITVGGKREEYRLTAKGLDFFPVFAVLVDWATQWITAGPVPLVIRHQACGERFIPSFACTACGVVLVGSAISMQARYQAGLKPVEHRHEA
ncbi:DNA-binding HxlR family transcriptional regulator [Arthrobacter ginsengisoli]|uniref:DNA-binding HxlR family transcriptional regulator n=1 Tax=Arthrobacter ginsengisoli TaxID=1356565 RepID=A0ABU1UG33_9MICC|nr:helix-turn-helix domain-containing protein [Arthrobacter ginsengisoli]MDR7084149.1 DNA-binding HxlR family transcriptional regulator [Arthrobacter ginsengisoli]